MNQNLYFFGQIEDDDARWLANNGLKIAVDRGAKLVAEGVVEKYVYVILSGRFRIFHKRTERLLSSLGTGEIIGEISMVDRRPTSASVVAEEPAVCLRVGHDTLRRKFKADEGFAMRFYRAIAMVMADRLRRNVLEPEGRDAGGDDLDTAEREQLDAANTRFKLALASIEG